MRGRRRKMSPAAVTAAQRRRGLTSPSQGAAAEEATSHVVCFESPLSVLAAGAAVFV